MMRSSLVVKCHTGGNNYPRFTQTKDRLTILENKAKVIRRKIALCDVEMDELYKELATVVMHMRRIRSDPLTHDLCIDEPWAEECKIFDI